MGRDRMKDKHPLLCVGMGAPLYSSVLLFIQPGAMSQAAADIQKDGQRQDGHRQKGKRSVKNQGPPNRKPGEGGICPFAGTCKGGHSMTVHRALRQWAQKILSVLGRWEKLWFIRFMRTSSCMLSLGNQRYIIKENRCMSKTVSTYESAPMVDKIL